MKIAIVGSRDFADYEFLKSKVNSFLDEYESQENDSIIIVSGGAKGADSLAEQYAKEYGYETLILKPDWKQYGRSAGILRNTDIVENADILIAFPTKSSIGTWDSIRKAKAKKIPVYVFPC
jgi:hypothetical protein